MTEESVEGIVKDDREPGHVDRGGPRSNVGADVYDIDPTVAAQLTGRRSAAAAAWVLTDEFVLIGAGEPIPVPGRNDLTYRFRAHSEYFYLTDRERPGGVLAFDPTDGWTEFVASVTREESFGRRSRQRSRRAGRGSSGARCIGSQRSSSQRASSTSASCGA